MRILGALFLVALVGVATFAGRCVLAWDDLPAYAKPSGFRQIDHEWNCTGMGSCWTILDYGCDAYCYHDWLLTSDHREYSDVIAEMTMIYRARGWRVAGCPYGGGKLSAENPCFIAVKGRYEACFVYHDFARYTGHRDELYDRFKQKVDVARTSLLVSTGCG